MHDVFVSYSHKDEKIMELICQSLEDQGVNCWYAPRNIAPGDDWREAIIRAISSAKIFILVYSKYSNHSRQVLNEVTAAFNASCVIIPFRIDGEQMTPALSYYLSNLHWMDATDLPRLSKIDELCSKVAGILNAEPSPPNRVKKEASTRKKPRWRVLAAACVLLLACVFAIFHNSNSDIAFADDPDAIEEAYKSVVQIECRYNGQLYGGVGFACFQEDIIVTDAYAVDAGTGHPLPTSEMPILIKTEGGTTLVAQDILAFDMELGIAIVSTAGSHNLPLFKIGNVEDLQRGSKLAALGRHAAIGEYLGNESGYLMFSKKGETGSAGAPLLSPEGKVVGVMHLSTADASYAIPIEQIIAMWTSISG